MKIIWRHKGRFLVPFFEEGFITVLNAYDTNGKCRILGYSAWCQRVSEYEIRYKLVNKANSCSIHHAFFRILGDQMQWHERSSVLFERAHYADLSVEYLKAFEDAMKHYESCNNF